jgi:hypothetical protein
LLQLSNLLLDGFCVQLQPDDGFQGVLGLTNGATSLKRLVLRHCELSDSGNAAEALTAATAAAAAAAEGLAAALALLPSELEHLSVKHLSTNGDPVQFPTTALERLQHC